MKKDLIASLPLIFLMAFCRPVSAEELSATVITTPIPDIAAGAVTFNGSDASESNSKVKGQFTLIEVAEGEYALYAVTRDEESAPEFWLGSVDKRPGMGFSIRF